MTAHLDDSKGDLNPSAAVYINLGDGTNATTYYTPGVVNWVVDSKSADAGLPNAYKTFCIELTQGITAGTSYTYQISTLESSPKPGSSQTGGSGGMGTAKANLIRDLWGTFYGSIGTSGNNAAAFQLALWKIEYDGPTSTSPPGLGHPHRLQQRQLPGVRL